MAIQVYRLLHNLTWLTHFVICSGRYFLYWPESHHSFVPRVRTNLERAVFTSMELLYAASYLEKCDYINCIYMYVCVYMLVMLCVYVIVAM